MRVGGKSEWVDVFMTTDADHSESVRCYMFLLQSRIFRDRTRGSIYQHLWRACISLLLSNRGDGCLRVRHGGCPCGYFCLWLAGCKQILVVDVLTERRVGCAQ